ncbi:MAG: DUF1343 domain-containing protein [Bacteroidota bacterium]
MRQSFLLLLLLVFFVDKEIACAQEFGAFPSVKTGAEQSEKYLPLLKDKKIALVVNATSYIGNTHLVDSLLLLGVTVKKIFAPEHGFRGTADAGDEIANTIDSKTKLPIVSLYGNHKKPTADDLVDVDIVIYDIQDVGVRFYTYISTLQYVMEACAENKKQLLILDRPNPNGWYIDGPVMEKNYESFVGMQPIPIVYAMTSAEYAQMLNGENWLSDSLQCDLKIISCDGYDHTVKYVLPRKPSPNLTNMTAVYLYPSTCLFEGTPLSVGRGTDRPFQLVGYPGSKIGKTYFTPLSKAGANNPVYNNQQCLGLDFSIYKGGYFFEHKGIFLSWLIQFYLTYQDKPEFFTPYFDKLAGTDALKTAIVNGKSDFMIHQDWQPDIQKFKTIRKKYLLYPDFE